jgi:hypothetical protein
MVREITKVAKTEQKTEQNKFRPENRLFQFPESFKRQPRFDDLLAIAEEITTHPAMKVHEPYVLENMIRASLIFTACFYGNLVSLLYFVVQDLRNPNPLAVRKNTRFLHLILELATGELATRNIRIDSGEFAPHYVSMLEAAQAAGVDTRVVEQFISQLQNPQITVEAASRQPSFVPQVRNYLIFSDRCTKSFTDCFATISLRELYLAEPFSIIAANLPTQQRYEKYRSFINSHVVIDRSEHGTLMAQALEEITDVDRVLSTMIEFLRFRKTVYDACLAVQPIY